MKARPANAADAIVLDGREGLAPAVAVAQRGDAGRTRLLAVGLEHLPMASPCHISSKTQHERKDVISGSWWAGVSNRSRR